ncbi:pyruvate ferredoxin oxidoreductase [Clostridiisalibacter paucivorans]|uniref:pyruvate ferredoxin oxidoreductase n=1 Tax=Clostridiisalibacter paucivorans TaxID=408753 RepID=UPI00047973CB|nr:pyruvate ferredoxin oxidoreductase [Clostridiisalibacter paucivorans]
MSIKDKLSGNEAIATAMKQINPDVVAAFPITPSTEVPQYFSQFVANGTVDTEFVAVESEHSAMSACVGASAAGARVMTATSANGLALMWEILYIASSMRLPIVMSVINRALSGPINIHNDHSDSMGARDSGWIQLYSEDNQEAYDNIIQAIKISEHGNVKLPVMVCLDGFIISHSVENIEILDTNKVRAFIGEYNPTEYLLNTQEPVAMGPLDLPPHYFEHKRQQAEGIKNAKDIILDVAKEYEQISGRKYGLFEEYRMEDAEVAIIVLNSTAGTAKEVVDMIRENGAKAGLIKLRVFRPFPSSELKKALSNVKVVAVMDKAESFSDAGGPMFVEVRSALYGQESPKIVNYIYGLGGRDVRKDDILKVYDEMFWILERGTVDNIYNYLGLKE